MKSTLPYILLTAVALSGCAATMNTGAETSSCTKTKGRCMDMLEAWQESNDYRPQDKLAEGKGGITPFLPEPVPNMAAIKEPKPLLMPARVLRVWVNAYEDNDGNLVYPTRVFLEVTPRRWNVGYSAAQAINSSRTVTPLVAIPPPHSKPAEQKNAATAPENREKAHHTADLPDTLPAGTLAPLK